MEILPNELISMISNYLVMPQHILSLAATCKIMYQLHDNKLLRKYQLFAPIHKQIRSRAVTILDPTYINFKLTLTRRKFYVSRHVYNNRTIYYVLTYFENHRDELRTFTELICINGTTNPSIREVVKCRIGKCNKYSKQRAKKALRRLGMKTQTN